MCQARPRSGGSRPGFAAARRPARRSLSAPARGADPSAPPRRAALGPTQESGGARREESSAQRSDPNAGAGPQGPYKHRAGGCVAQSGLGEVCGVGFTEQCCGESSVGRGPRYGLDCGREECAR